MTFFFFFPLPAIEHKAELENHPSTREKRGRRCHGTGNWGFVARDTHTFEHPPETPTAGTAANTAPTSHPQLNPLCLIIASVGRFLGLHLCSAVPCRDAQHRAGDLGTTGRPGSAPTREQQPLPQTSRAGGPGIIHSVTSPRNKIAA